MPAVEEPALEGGGGNDASTPKSSSAVPLDPAKKKAAAVFILARQGDFAEATKLLEESPQLWHEPDGEGHTLLHWGALAGHVPFVTQALSQGAKVDATAANGQTPLMWAVIKGMVGTAKILLDAKADPLAADSMGATLLILAVQHQQHACFLMLVSLGPREKLLRGADSNGCGPVHWAAYKGDLASLRLLDYFDADFAVVDDTKMTPLHRAVQASQAQVCEFLIEKEVDPSQVDVQGRTCMDIALANQDALMRRTLNKSLEVCGSRNSVTLAGNPNSPEDVEAPPTGANLRKKDKVKDEAKKMKEKFMHNAAATFWLVSVSLATFQYLVDLRPVSWTVAPTAALLFELGVPSSLGLFFFVAFSDPGKVPPRAKTCSGVEELMKAFKAGENPDFSRLCTTTWVLKGLRTKYCTQTGACVNEFDHFCGWLNVAIGRGNHRPFIILACVEALTQLCHIYLCWMCASHLVTVQSLSDWVYGVAVQYPLLAFIAILHSLTSPGIVMLALNQLRLIGISMTTNEMINIARYSHFWEETQTSTGQKRRVYRNPFNKGGVLKNCLDFWWTRRRGDLGPGAGGRDRPSTGAGTPLRAV